MNLNKCMIIGNLGKDPEEKISSNGNSFVKFSVATGEEWTDKSGDTKKRVQWHNVVCFKKLADICIKYLSKGSKVYVEGKMRTSTWETDEGEKKSINQIVAYNVLFLTPKDKEGDVDGDRETKTYTKDEGLPF